MNLLDGISLVYILYSYYFAIPTECEILLGQKSIDLHIKGMYMLVCK